MIYIYINSNRSMFLAYQSNRSNFSHRISLLSVSPCSLNFFLLFSHSRYRILLFFSVQCSIQYGACLSKTTNKFKDNFFFRVNHSLLPCKLKLNVNKAKIYNYTIEQKRIQTLTVPILQAINILMENLKTQRIVIFEG